MQDLHPTYQVPDGKFQELSIIMGIRVEMKRLYLYLLSLLCILLLAGLKTDTAWAATGTVQLMPCTDPLGCIEIRAGEPVVVAGFFDLTSLSAVLGQDQSQAAALAAHDFGTIMGHRIEFRAMDTQCYGPQALQTFQTLAAVSTLAGLTGPTCNDVLQDILVPISTRGLSVVVPATMDMAFSHPLQIQGGQWQPGYYTTAADDNHQGVLAAHYAFHHLRARTLAVVDDGNPALDTLRQAMIRAFRIYGGTIVGQESLTLGHGTATAVWEKVVARQPDAVYLPVGHQDALRLIQAARALPALQSIPLLASADWLTSHVANAVQGTGLAIHAAGPYIPESLWAEFHLRWQAFHAQTPATLRGPHAYDAMSLLLQAIRMTARQDTAGNLSVGRLALRQGLTATSGFPGMTGVLACTETGQCGVQEAWGIFRLATAPGAIALWPPPLVHKPNTPAISVPRFMGRSLDTISLYRGPDTDFPIVGTILRGTVLHVSGTTSDQTWYRLATGGWLATQQVELHDVGLPIISALPILPVPPATQLRTGAPDWPVPFQTSHEAADGMTLRLEALMRPGNPGYNSTVPLSALQSLPCGKPPCGRVATRISLANTSRSREQQVSVNDFYLHRIRAHDTFPERIEASALLCKVRRFKPDGDTIFSGIGFITRDLCFEVPDTARVSWLYALVYKPSRSDREPETEVYFSLQ